MQIKLKLQANQEQQIEKQIKIQTDRQTVNPHQEKGSSRIAGAGYVRCNDDDGTGNG